MRWQVEICRRVRERIRELVGILQRDGRGKKSAGERPPPGEGGGRLTNGGAGGEIADNASTVVDGPAALAIKSEDQVVEGHERRSVTNGDARAAQLLHPVAEPLLHVHLRHHHPSHHKMSLGIEHLIFHLLYIIHKETKFMTKRLAPGIF